MPALGFHCCVQAFSSCGEQGLRSSCDMQASLVVASHCRAWALELMGSVTVAHGLSCSIACGIFLDQGLNPCPLYWQVNS